MKLDIQALTPEALPEAAALFDAYRVFYGQAPDRPAAHRFLAQRLRDGDATLLLARVAGRAGAPGEPVEPVEPAIGFVQLYPSYSSVACRRILILNDLYVDRAARGLGVGRALLHAAQSVAEQAGAARLVLETATDNHRARALYEDFGFAQASGFVTYTLACAPASALASTPAGTPAGTKGARCCR